MTEPIEGKLGGNVDESKFKATRPRPVAGLAASRIDPESATPLYRQIYDALRDDILEGALVGGQRLAATRALAEELSVSRNTVLEAVEQLVAEGYLVSRVGAGTFVAKNLPDDLVRLGGSAEPIGSGPSPGLSTRGKAFLRWADEGRGGVSRPFQIGRPALDVFPWATWSRLAARRARDVPREWLDYADTAGYQPLRAALAHYLRSSRGLMCAPEQIVIVRGTQQGLDLAARVLLDVGDQVWIEDPGYPDARIAFAAGGAREVPVPVDEKGINVAAGRERAPNARLAYVTPSHQYPLGVTMSLARRLELLRWAREADAWIVEDDYDSEYRFAGRPLASLAGLDGGQHVIYLGTLSKVLFPALRLGYLVVPHQHVDAFVGARYTSDRHSSVLEQAVVADFFDQGHFARHIRRMRQLYAERQRRLRAAVETYLGDEIEIQKTDIGLHDVGWLRRRKDDTEVVAQAAAAGIRLAAVSAHCQETTCRPGLLFGYAGFPVEELVEATKKLAEVLALS